MAGPGVDIVVGDLTDTGSLAVVVVGVGAAVMTHGAAYGSDDYEAIDYGAFPTPLTVLDGRTVRVALMSSIGGTATARPSRTC